MTKFNESYKSVMQNKEEAHTENPSDITTLTLEAAGKAVCSAVINERETGVPRWKAIRVADFQAKTLTDGFGLSTED